MKLPTWVNVMTLCRGGVGCEAGTTPSGSVNNSSLNSMSLQARILVPAVILPSDAAKLLLRQVLSTPVQPTPTSLLTQPDAATVAALQPIQSPTDEANLQNAYIAHGKTNSLQPTAKPTAPALPGVKPTSPKPNISKPAQPSQTATAPLPATDDPATRLGPTRTSTQGPPEPPQQGPPWRRPKNELKHLQKLHQLARKRRAQQQDQGTTRAPAAKRRKAGDISGGAASGGEAPEEVDEEPWQVGTTTHGSEERQGASEQERVPGAGRGEGVVENGDALLRDGVVRDHGSGPAGASAAGALAWVVKSEAAVAAVPAYLQSNVAQPPKTTAPRIKGTETGTLAAEQQLEAPPPPTGTPLGELFGDPEGSDSGSDSPPNQPQHAATAPTSGPPGGPAATLNGPDRPPAAPVIRKAPSARQNTQAQGGGSGARPSRMVSGVAASLLPPHARSAEPAPLAAQGEEAAGASDDLEARPLRPLIAVRPHRSLSALAAVNVASLVNLQRKRPAVAAAAVVKAVAAAEEEVVPVPLLGGGYSQHSVAGGLASGGGPGEAPKDGSWAAEVAAGLGDDGEEEELLPGTAKDAPGRAAICPLASQHPLLGAIVRPPPSTARTVASVRAAAAAAAAAVAGVAVAGNVAAAAVMPTMGVARRGAGGVGLGALGRAGGAMAQTAQLRSHGSGGGSGAAADWLSWAEMDAEEAAEPEADRKANRTFTALAVEVSDPGSGALPPAACGGGNVGSVISSPFTAQLAGKDAVTCLTNTQACAIAADTNTTGPLCPRAAPTAPGVPQPPLQPCAIAAEAGGGVIVPTLTTQVPVPRTTAVLGCEAAALGKEPAGAAWDGPTGGRITSPPGALPFVKQHPPQLSPPVAEVGPGSRSADVPPGGGVQREGALLDVVAGMSPKVLRQVEAKSGGLWEGKEELGSGLERGWELEGSPAWVPWPDAAACGGGKEDAGEERRRPLQGGGGGEVGVDEDSQGEEVEEEGEVAGADGEVASEGQEGGAGGGSATGGDGSLLALQGGHDAVGAAGVVGQDSRRGERRGRGAGAACGPPPQGQQEGPQPGGQRKRGQRGGSNRKRPAGSAAGHTAKVAAAGGDAGGGIEMGLYADVKAFQRQQRKARWLNGGAGPESTRPVPEIRGPPPCRFYRLGRCNKGSECGFPHVGLPVTRLLTCRFWRQGRCARGEGCVFSHDPNLKEPCIEWISNGACPAGPACPLAHPSPEDAEALREYYRETAARETREAAAAAAVSGPAGVAAEAALTSAGGAVQGQEGGPLGPTAIGVGGLQSTAGWLTSGAGAAVMDVAAEGVGAGAPGGLSGWGVAEGGGVAAQAPGGGIGSVWGDGGQGLLQPLRPVLQRAVNTGDEDF